MCQGNKKQQQRAINYLLTVVCVHFNSFDTFWIILMVSDSFSGLAKDSSHSTKVDMNMSAKKGTKSRAKNDI